VGILLLESLPVNRVCGRRMIPFFVIKWVVQYCSFIYSRF